MARLEQLTAGQQIPYGGDNVAIVDADLAARFVAGDRIVVVHESGDVLHIPAADHAKVSGAVTAARGAFAALAGCDDEQISRFFEHFADLLADDALMADVLSANAADVAAAGERGRSTTRLVMTPAMRASMIDGLRAWGASNVRRHQQVSTVDHPQWRVEQWRAPLGVVGFVFEGRPNVFADATGVLRTGNTAVFRIGSDALGTATAIMERAVRPALHAAGLPEGCVQLVESASHASGWALFADTRLSLAIARGSGRAVAQLGAVARQHGVPVSLHGTGGAWIVANDDADPHQLSAAVEWSLDRKVCNTLNVCCVRTVAQADAVRDAAQRAAARRGTEPVIHDAGPDDDLGHEFEWEDAPEFWLVQVPSVDRAVDMFNRCSPRFVASLIADDPSAHDSFYAAIDAPFVGDGFTRWVDGQFALNQPELGLSNWQSGRLFARGGVLSGDSVHTIRTRAFVADPDLHR